ncbi:histidine kinase dimerization/phosphoacceptor domain -containing protein [Dongia sp.]|uniref:histidine kinase dimerization/phosphoacceptor domain -containing protein n=1 Tax=Dongia sp. TaxID=1977262 RepID=UPI0035B4A15B
MIASLFQPLRHRLILLFAIVLMVPSGFGIWAAIGEYRSQMRTAREAMQQFAALASNYESNLLWQSQQIVQSLTTDENVLAAVRGSADPRLQDACNDAFYRAIKPFPPYGGAVLYDLAGTPRCQWDPKRQIINVSQRAWFATVKKTGAATISGYLSSPALKEPIISFAAPVYDVDGVMKGAVSLGIRLNWLSAIGQEPGLPGIAEVTLVDRDGRILVSSASEAEATTRLPAAAEMEAILHGKQRLLDADGRDGTARIYAANALGNDSLFVLLSIPRAAVVDPLRRDLLVQIGILCLVSIAGMMAAILGARLLVTKWTEKLTRAADAMALGRLDTQSELRGAPIEIWQLGENLKSMATRLEHREADLRETLRQKQLMLREIHHRVKNNLQIVTSLLNLYARVPRGDSFRQAFTDLQVRINALALVHRHLYESEDLKEIDLAPFMRNLCSLLQDASGVSARRVTINVAVPALRMSGDRAVPLALLTTEILTNSLKHAFPDQRRGRIDIEMVVDGAGDAHLSIIDDGIGPATIAEADASTTMGATLIAAFAKQLGGKMNVAGPPGSTTHIDFNIRPAGQVTDRSPA